MMRQLLLCLFCMNLLAGCADSSRKVEQERMSFKTTDASRLYFHNVRSIRYHIEEIGKDHMQLCRHKDFLDTPLPLYPVIANNYMHDEAYIVHEIADSLRQNDAFLLVGNSAGDTLSLDLRTHEAHYRFAKALYNAIVEDLPLQICAQGHCHSFLNDKDMRKTVRLVYRDYFRLVQLFK